MDIGSDNKIMCYKTESILGGRVGIKELKEN